MKKLVSKYLHHSDYCDDNSDIVVNKEAEGNSKKKYRITLGIWVILVLVGIFNIFNILYFSKESRNHQILVDSKKIIIDIQFK